MNGLQIFNSEEFGQIRTVVLDNEPWFVGKDVALALGYSETNAMTKRLDTEDSISAKLSGMNMKSILINESGLYAAIFGSKLESAKTFKRWVTAEVLPTLRKTGTYTMSTAYQYPVSPAALESATNAGRLFERIMKSEGCYPHEIAMMVKTIFCQAGIDVPEFAVKIPEYQQLTLPLEYNEITPTK